MRTRSSQEIPFSGRESTMSPPKKEQRISKKIKEVLYNNQNVGVRGTEGTATETGKMSHERPFRLKQRTQKFKPKSIGGPGI